MSRRFFRENSQIIAGILIPSYFGGFMVYRANLSDMLREQYEFKTKKETYLGISIKESEDLKKASLRLPQNFNRKLNFIRSNSLDFASFGFCNLRQGALVALPPSYFANSRAELADLIPPSGFGNFAGKTITMSEIEEKLDESDKNALLDSLVLSPDAKAFGVTRELTVASNFMLAMSDKFLDLICLSAAYWYSFRKTRLVKMQHFERRRVYLMTSLIAGIVILSSRLFIQRFVDRSIEKETCNMGLDCAEGSLEYYDKMLERNKILRKVLPNGEKLIDAEGNHLSKAIQVPLTNYYLYFPNNGMKLTERKKLCESEFSKMVINLVEKKNKAQLQMQRGEASRVESSRTANNSDKEWEIFKKIRLFLETKKGSGN